jgi:tRNA(adenine34) deaminase
MNVPSFMDLALKTAQNAGKSGEVPIGCVIVRDYEVIATAGNLTSFARIRRLYYGAVDPKGGAVESGVRFFASPTCHHVPDIYPGIGEHASATLLREFFRERR